MLLTAAGLARADGPALKEVRRIPLPGVEGRIDHLGVDANAKHLYVAALGNDSLEVIDLTAAKPATSIKGLKEPQGVRVAPNSGKVVVASGEDGRVRIYDSREMKLLGEINGLPDADNVRIDRTGQTAYIGYGQGAIAVIDIDRAAKVREIPMDGHPESFQLEDEGAAGKRIFVNVPSAGEIEVADLTTGAVTSRWKLTAAAANFPMALDQAGQRLMVACRQPAKLIVLDTTSGRPVAELPCCGDADDLFFDPTTKRIYITGGEGKISVIEHAANDQYKNVAQVDTAPGARTSLLLPDQRQLLVAVPHRGKQPAEVRVFEVEQPSRSEK